MQHEFEDNRPWHSASSYNAFDRSSDSISAEYFEAATDDNDDIDSDAGSYFDDVAPNVDNNPDNIVLAD